MKILFTQENLVRRFSCKRTKILRLHFSFVLNISRLMHTSFSLESYFFSAQFFFISSKFPIQKETQTVKNESFIYSANTAFGKSGNMSSAKWQKKATKLWNKKGWVISGCYGRVTPFDKEPIKSGVGTSDNQQIISFFTPLFHYFCYCTETLPNPRALRYTRKMCEYEKNISISLRDLWRKKESG